MSPDFGDPRLLDRFWDKVYPEPNTGCWLWGGYLDRQGYGQARFDKKMQLIHRIFYNQLVGSLGELVLDHLCRTPSCVNPGHLEAVDISTNTRRGVLGFELTGKCRKGLHDMTIEANLYRESNGERRCGPCRDEINGRRTVCSECGMDITQAQLKRHTARKHPRKE